MMKRFATYYPYEQKLLIEGHHKPIQEATKNGRSFADSRLMFAHVAKEIGKKVVLVGFGVGVIGLLIPTSKLILYPVCMIIGKSYYHAIDWVHYDVAKHIHNLSSMNISSDHYIASIDPHQTPSSSFAKDGHYFLEKIDGKMKNHFEGVKDFLERNQ
jgi:tetrahydromethanopterin S-methyltransferase subunit B